MEWQSNPLETVPRDGDTEVLLVNRETGTMLVAFYDTANSAFPWATLDGPSYPKNWPDAWMPLPAPPKGE